MIEIGGQQAKRCYDQGATMQPTFKIGDKVLSRHRNIATTLPNVL